MSDSQIECAKITDCAFTNDGKIKYSAKACRSNVEFQFSKYEYLFPGEQGQSWTCPKNHYVKMEYFPWNCWGGMCDAIGMDLVTDSNYFQQNC